MTEELNKICWICRRTKVELENIGMELFQMKGTNYDEHTVCRACEDIIFGLSREMDDEMFEQKTRKNIKYILQELIEDSDILS